MNQQIIGHDYSILSHHMDSSHLLSPTKAQQVRKMFTITQIISKKKSVSTIKIAFLCMLKGTGPQLKEVGFDSDGIRESVIQGMSMEEALNAPNGEGSPLSQHVSHEERAESSPGSTPAGRGEFCFLWFDRSEQLNIASGNNSLGVASLLSCP